MIGDGSAYVSKKNLKKGDRDEVIRFKNPNKKIIFNDLIVGDVEVNTTDLGDFVIAKDMETPIFHLTNVIDDYEMGITHIIRGQDHIPNTPKTNSNSRSDWGSKTSLRSYTFNTFAR